GPLKQDIQDEVAALLAPERQQSLAASAALRKADAAAARLDVEFQSKVQASPAAQAAQAALEKADGVLQRAESGEQEALVDVAAARAKALVVQVQQEALDNVTAESQAFALFKNLKPEDFEDAIRKGANSTKIGELYPPLPEKPASMNATEQAAYQK